MEAVKRACLLIVFLIFLAGQGYAETWMGHTVKDYDVEGVECLLRPDKVFWFEGETPVLKVGFRNRGMRRLYIMLEPVFWEISIDRKRFRRMSNISYMVPELSPFFPGCWYDDIPVSASKNCRSQEHKKMLTPGVHVIRLAFFAHLDNKAHNSTVVRVVSNPVEIKILPKRDSSPEMGIFFQWRFELDKAIPVSLRPSTQFRYFEFGRKQSSFIKLMVVEKEATKLTLL